MLRPVKVSLLIVEDDPNLRYLLETAARRSGLFEPVSSAMDGQDALDQLRERETPSLPDLIVTDLSMPRMGGLDLVRAIKSDDRMRNIPIGIITSSDAAIDRELALAAGACSFLPKPYGLDALTQALVSIHDSVTTAGAVYPS